MVVRRGADGRAERAGAQVVIGGNDVYVSLCRRHWREEVGDEPPALPFGGAKAKGKVFEVPESAASPTPPNQVFVGDHDDNDNDAESPK